MFFLHFLSLLLSPTRSTPLPPSLHLPHLGLTFEILLDIFLIYFGETHEQPAVLQLQLQIISHIKSLLPSLNPIAPPQCHVILEHFNFAQQHLLDAYARGEINIEQLQQEYDKVILSHCLHSPFSLLSLYSLYSLFLSVCLSFRFCSSHFVVLRVLRDLTCSTMATYWTAPRDHTCPCMLVSFPEVTASIVSVMSSVFMNAYNVSMLQTLSYDKQLIIMSWTIDCRMCESDAE